MSLLLVLAGGLVACSGGSGNMAGVSANTGTTPGNYIITVTGTSGSLVQTATLSLTVN